MWKELFTIKNSLKIHSSLREWGISTNTSFICVVNEFALSNQFYANFFRVRSPDGVTAKVLDWNIELRDFEQ